MLLGILIKTYQTRLDCYILLMRRRLLNTTTVSHYNHDLDFLSKLNLWEKFYVLTGIVQ